MEADIDTNFANTSNITFIGYKKDEIFKIVADEEKCILMSSESYTKIEEDKNIIRYSKLDRDTIKYVNIII